MSSQKRSGEAILGRRLGDLLEADDQQQTIEDIVTGEPPEVQITEAPATEIHIDDLEVLQSFVEESTEHMAAVEDKIVQLERTYTPDLVNEVFRAMHTVKGTASFFGENVIAVLSHRLESLLDGCREGRIEMTGELADILLAGADELSRMIKDLSASTAGKTENDLPLTVPLDAGATESLMARIAGMESAGAVAGGSGAAETPVVADVVNVPIDDELYQNFIAESTDLLAEVETDMLSLERAPENGELIDRAFRHIHTIKGNSGFLGLGQVEELCIQIENVLETLRTGEHDVSKGVVTEILRSVDSLGRLIRDPPGGQSGIEDEQDQPLGEILVDMGLTDSESIERALDAQERKLGEILISNGALSEKEIETALDRQKKTRKSGIMQEAVTSERHAVRVDVEKLDRLFELVGELIMAEAMVVSNPDLDGLVLERFNRSAAYLGKITRQMQEIAMSVRMIPLEGLLNKMRRLVRDLSRKTGKPVEIDVAGQDTEMDRNVIEVLSDPLVHMIRNCVDHGIESEDEREKAGKNRTGHINLSARYEGSEIWIAIRDDGRGLRRDSILTKAIDRGITTEEEADKLADAEVWDFLFQPGFSTKEQVTEVSGRGVGMDVVKRNIDQLRGRIIVTTEPGLWTEFTLRIPLTLAIVDGVITRVGNTLYAVPLNEIREFQQVLPDRINSTATSGEVLELREEIIPIVRLSRVFGIRIDQDNTGREVFIVVQTGSGKAALLVDEIIGYNQIVVKALPETLGHMQELVGCTVLGSGDVSLIVDTNSLVGKAKAQVA